MFATVHAEKQPPSPDAAVLGFLIFAPVGCCVALKPKSLTVLSAVWWSLKSHNFFNLAAAKS
jgi:hypothetical protein